MARRRLDNGAWGFDSQCFVCDPRNPRGLGIPFFGEDDRVVAEFRLPEAFSGAPRAVHGGVVLAVLDEAMAWAAIAVAGCFAMTRTTSATFVRPVRPNRLHRVEAVVEDRDPRTVWARALVLADGEECASARAELAVLSAGAAPSVIGEVDGADRSYLGGADRRDPGRS